MLPYIVKFTIDDYKNECLVIAKNGHDAREYVRNNYLGAIITESKQVREKMIVEINMF